MAKKGAVDIIKEFNSFDIDNLSRDEKIKLIASSSKTLYDRYKRLKESGLDSPYLNKMKKPPTRYLKGSLNKMNNTKLNDILGNLVLKSRNKTSSIKGTKEFYKKFKKTTGVEYTTISKETWEKIRKRIEEAPGDSDEIIQAYATTNSDEEAEQYLDTLEAVNTEIQDINDIEDLDKYLYD